MDYSTPGFPALHYLPEFVQIHVPWVGDTIQPSHPPPRSSPFAFSLSPSWITALSWQRGLHNSMKLWAMPYRATQEGCVIVESSKMWSTGGGNGKSLKYSCLKNPMNMNSVLWPWASFTPYQTLKKKYLVRNTLHDWLKSNVMVEMKVICKWQIPVECEILLLYKLSWCLKITLLSQECGKLGKYWNPVNHRKEQSLKGAWTQPFILVEDVKAQVGWLVQGHIASELQNQK